MKNNEIKIKHGSSSLSEFVKKPLPSDEEVEAFEKFATDEAKEEEIKDSLAKIYHDEKGNKVDIKKLIVKRKRGFFFNLFTFTIVVFVIAGSGYAIYNYIYLKLNVPAEPVSLAFSAPKETAAGEEFYYNLTYKNEDKVAIKNIEIKLKYPDNFIFLESDPAASKNNDTWTIPGLDSHRSDIIKIKGKLINAIDTNNIILADMTYRPENFSSEFKKSASSETKINDLGLEISLVNSVSALVGEDNEILVKFQAKNQNYINSFRLRLDYPEEVVIIDKFSTSTEPKKIASTTPLIMPNGTGSWLISNLGKNENQFKIKFKVKEKKQPAINLKLQLDFPAAPENRPANEANFMFYEKNLTYDVIKSDLNINIIINGSAADQAVDFGQTLNYSISYANKGETLMKDIIIMAVLEGDFIDWQTLTDAKNGKVSGNTISWSKSEIESLAELQSGGEGIIDFSVKLKPQSAIDLSQNYQIKSYIKYSLAGKSASGENQSNTIINKINSDLNLTEELRYFNSDNIAVGSGPLPPKAGQTTSLKVYWTISNNLHDLENLIISFTLPAGISWNGKNQSSVGALIYDGSTNKVSWQISRLQIMAYKASAEFNLNVTPTEAQRNTIMVILPGTNISALDTVTGTIINKTLKAKTSKLDDDNMVGGDGVVQ